MTTLVPLTVAVPLAAAGVLAAVGHFVPARAHNAVGIVVAAALTVICVVLIFGSRDETLHYWFGGWHPRGGIAIGISFSVDPLAAGIAALVGVLGVAALVQCWDYFADDVPQHFHVLMLVFLASMVGFALSSDLFNMFVFFELLSTAGFALTGYRIERPSVLQGAINFAVVNSIGAFLLLTGIALLYGRSGALNLAQIGEVLSRHPADGLVVVAFALIVVGLLTKAGAVPFHFWLSDAYAVAPAPVCVLFAGVMSDLALHAVARIYWLGFSGPLGGEHAEAVRAVLIGIGVLTALLGAVMAFLQSSLKRMLAFIVVSHVGVFLCGIALLTAHGLAGTTVYLVADGLVKGALFCAIGYLGRRVGHADELEAHGQCRGMNAAAALFVIAAVGVAAVPPFGTFVARALESQALPGRAWEWLPAVVVVATATTGAAVLRATARIFFGIGPARDELLQRAPAGESEEQPSRGGVLLWLPAVPLLAGGLGLAFVPGIAARAIEHAERAVDRAATARELLHGASPPPIETAHFHPSAASYVYGAAAALLALALAASTLGPLARRSGGRPVRRLKLLHEGLVADYVTWLIVGSAALTGVLAALIH